MKINDKYSIELCIIEQDENGACGNVYNSMEDFRKYEGHDALYRFGYYVVNLDTGYVPDECNDWNDSPEEALADYRYNCTNIYMSEF